MVSELFLDLLTKQSKARLTQMRQQAEADIERLQFEMSYIDRALEAKGAPRPSGRAPQANDRSEPATTTNSDGAHQSKRKSKRGPILEIARSAPPTHVWFPAGMRDALKVQGHEVTADAARLAMIRMQKQGLFRRGPDGQGFQLVPQNGDGANALPPEGRTPEGEDRDMRFQVGTGQGDR